MFFWFFLMRDKRAFVSFPTHKSLWSRFPLAKAVRFCSVHWFGSWMLTLAFLSRFVTDGQHGLRDLFGMRPKNPFAECSLTVLVWYPEKEMLCTFVSKIRHEWTLHILRCLLSHLLNEENGFQRASKVLLKLMLRYTQRQYSNTGKLLMLALMFHHYFTDF